MACVRTIVPPALSAKVAPFSRAGSVRRGLTCVRRASGTLVEVATGRSIPLEGVITLGTAEDNVVVLQGAKVAAHHAKLESRGGRVYCTALAGTPGDFMSDTFTWMTADTQLRGGVDYMVAPASKISFGASYGDNVWSVEFEEQGNSAVADMLMKGMAQGASEEVQQLLGQRA